jgi:hypothetical protein
VRARAAVAVLLCTALALLAAAGASAAARSPIPLLAYYYIWFEVGSWDRAKRDYPALGRYSSDERTVMRTHVRWAKASGINGFLVSWKDTPALDRRLARLAEIAREERFKLGVVYQGLDFHRRARSPAVIAADLDFFARRFGRDPAFRIFDRPLVVWSGTWKYTTRQIAGVTRGRRDRLLILASEKNADAYRRVASLVDGDAYYWSSVDPRRDRHHAQKLAEMGRTVHGRRGLWIAPAAPGFDARMIGGRRVVPRDDGAMLRRQLEVAGGAEPDAIGLISWNEFSENSHVEPSRAHGRRALEVLADVRGARAPAAPDVDSSEPIDGGNGAGAPLVGGVGLLAALGLAFIGRRIRRREEP